MVVIVSHQWRCPSKYRTDGAVVVDYGCRHAAVEIRFSCSPQCDSASSFYICRRRDGAIASVVACLADVNVVIVL